MRTGSGLRALLLDDDEYALELLRALLDERYPGLEIETRTEPDPSGSFDLYFLDDDFAGRRRACELARAIRGARPEALVLAFSAALDARTLKELVNAGCDGVCDKEVPGDVPAMLRALDRCLDERARAAGAAAGPLRLLPAFRRLVEAWNRRLDGQAGRP